MQVVQKLLNVFNSQKIILDSKRMRQHNIYNYIVFKYKIKKNTSKLIF